MKISAHPLLAAPSARMIKAAAAAEALPPVEALAKLLARRAEAIAAEKADPLRQGWEPPVWRTADALLDWPIAPAAFAGGAEGWEAWKRSERERCGFAAPVKMLLILGANRSGKSEYEAKRALQLLALKPAQRVAAYHMSNPRSVRDMQPLFWKYFPPEWKIQTKSAEEYVAYKRKTGFSESSFILPNGSECFFGNYQQERSTAIEGIEPDFIVADELIPVDWIETLIFRLATRAGRGVIGFTPVLGYSPAVRLFCDGARPTLFDVAYMLPRSRSAPNLPATLGLAPEELAEWKAAAAERRASRAPASRPARPGALGASAPAAADDFERLPRVLRPANPQLGVLYFHSRDNPYGNPLEVLETAAAQGKERVRVRCYGFAARAESGKFPKFRLDRHVLPAAAMPASGETLCVIDPAGDRNWFLLWVRRAGRALYALREWPGSAPVPQAGVLGPWAVASGKREGNNDGARGEGQDSLGWGLLRYKQEIARLEGWAACAAPQGWEDVGPDDPDDWAADGIIARLVDSRAASAPKIELDRPTTLYTQLVDLGLDVSLAPGGDIGDGLATINSLLDCDLDAPASDDNAPALYVSDACPNLIWALQCWKWADGEKGASKDPIDCLRYAVQSDFFDIRGGQVRAGARGGGGGQARAGARGQGEDEGGGGGGNLPRATFKGRPISRGPSARRRFSVGR